MRKLYFPLQFLLLSLLSPFIHPAKPTLTISEPNVSEISYTFSDNFQTITVGITKSTEEDK